MQERSLKILYCDYISHFQDRLENTSSDSILPTRIKSIYAEVFKSLDKLNAPCLHDTFKINNTTYNVRDTKLEQPLRRATNYGLCIFSWLYRIESGISWGTSYGLGTIQSAPERVDWSQMLRFWNTCTLTVLHDTNIYNLHAWCISDCTFFKPALYIFCTPTYSRILAYCLMLSVLQTTENEFYLILSYTVNNYIQDTPSSHSRMIYADAYIRMYWNLLGRNIYVSQDLEYPCTCTCTISVLVGVSRDPTTII